MIPQVYELIVKVPSPPLNLVVTAGELMFSSPANGGGRNILHYQVQIGATGSDTWFLYSQIQVKHLSVEPDIPSKLLADLEGSVNIRVCAVNQAGPGQFAQISTILTGKAI